MRVTAVLFLGSSELRKAPVARALVRPPSYTSHCDYSSTHLVMCMHGSRYDIIPGTYQVACIIYQIPGTNHRRPGVPPTTYVPGTRHQLRQVRLRFVVPRTAVTAARTAINTVRSTSLFQTKPHVPGSPALLSTRKRLQPMPQLNISEEPRSSSAPLMRPATTSLRTKSC